MSLALLILMGCLQIGQPLKSATNITYGELKSMGGQIECTYSRGNQGIKTIITGNFLYAEKGNNIVLYGQDRGYIYANSSLVPMSMKKSNCKWYSISKGYVWSGPSINDTMISYLGKITASKKMSYSDLSCKYSKDVSIMIPVQKVCPLD